MHCRFLFYLLLTIGGSAYLPAGNSQIPIKWDPSNFVLISKLALRQQIRDIDISASTVQILRIDPSWYLSDKDEALDQRPKFHGYPIDYSAIVTDKNKATQLLSLISESALIDGDDSASICYEPHHAISIDLNDHHYAVLICFQCREIHVLGFKNDGLFRFDTGIKGDLESIYRHFGLEKTEPTYVHRDIKPLPKPTPLTVEKIDTKEMIRPNGTELTQPNKS